MFLWQPITIHRTTHSKSGFTLVELVVAFLILVIGVTAILELVSQSALNARYAKDKTTATMLAQQKLEELLSESELTTGEVEGDFGDAYPQFRWRGQIDEIGDVTSETGTNLLHITVTVEWMDRGQLRSVQVETLKASVPLLHPQEATTQQVEGTFSDFSDTNTPPIQGGGRQ